MKRIKNLMLVAIAAAASTAVHAQGAYAKFNVGYLFGAQSTSDYNATQNGSSGTFDLKKQSLGAGIGINAGFGFMLNENFGAELNLGYQIGKKNTTTTKTSNSNTTYDYKSSGMLINPGFFIQSGEESVRPFLRAGLLIGLGRNVIYNENGTTTVWGASSVISETTETKFKPGFGFNGAVGVNFGLSDNLFLTTELVYNGLSLWAKSGKLTKSTDDGVDQLPLLDVSDKQTEYLKSYTQGTPIDDTKPRQEITQSLNFSNWGLQVGIKINFGE